MVLAIAPFEIDKMSKVMSGLLACTVRDGQRLQDTITEYHKDQCIKINYKIFVFCKVFYYKIQKCQAEQQEHSQ